MIQKTSIGVVTEDITDVPEKILEEYQTEIVPTILDWSEGESLPGDNIYQRMREADKRGVKTFPKTSQPAPKAYLDAFQRQLRKFDKVLCITLSSKLSGCCNSAKQAKNFLGLEGKKRIFIIDSLNATAGQALMVLRTIELIQEQREIDEVIRELKSLIPKVHMYIFFEDPKWIESSGRITKSQANWIKRMKKINLHPLIEFKDGLLTKGGIVLGQDISEALFKKITKESKRARKENKKIRVVISHVDNPKAAEKLRKMLKEKINVEVPFISLAAPVIGVYLGPGSLAAGWTVI
jgi:DegV family protein with EDD domain